MYKEFNFKENCFDVLRIIAITIVMLSHSFRWFGIEKPSWLMFFTDGSIGVSMFFAMSGFLIMGAYNLASDTAGTSDVIVHALNFYSNQGTNYDVVVLLQPTSPLRTVQNVKDCLAAYDDTLDMVTTVKESSVSAVLCKENQEGFLEQVIGENNVRRQDAAKLYEYNDAVYVINSDALKEKGLGGFTKIKKCVMDEKSSVDIDTMLDWKFVEVLVKE